MNTQRPSHPSPVASKPIEVLTIHANADARVQGATSDNLGTGDLMVGLPDKISFAHFDVSALPESAVINSAELALTFRDDDLGANDVEVGVVREPWREAELTAANQPSVHWRGYTRTVIGGARVTWDVKSVVAGWASDARANHGFAFRGDGPLKRAYSREYSGSSAAVPTLRIRYIEP